MTLMDAKEYDNRRDLRRRNLYISIAVAIAVVIVIYFTWPYYVAHRMVDQFMDALVQHNYQEAYAVWHADPKGYPMDTFMEDWGPNSRWGIIKTFKIDRVITPPKMIGSSGVGGTGNGLIALVRINGIADEARIFVMKYKGQRILAFYPY